MLETGIIVIFVVAFVNVVLFYSVEWCMRDES